MNRFFARPTPLATTVLAVAASLLVASRGESQSANPPPASPVQVVAEAGFGGCVQLQRVLAVRVLLTNTGDPITEGTLELVGKGGRSTRRPFTLPRGARKSYRLFVSLDVDPNEPQIPTWPPPPVLGLRVWAHGRLIYDQPLDWKGSGQFPIVDLTGDEGGLDFLNGGVSTYLAQSVCVRIGPLVLRTVPLRILEDAPRHAGEWEAAALVVVSGSAWSRLDGEQRGALRGWVERGGGLLMVGADPDAWSDRDASELLPVSGLRRVSARAAPAFQQPIVMPWELDGERLRRVIGATSRPGPAVPAIVGRLKPGALALAGRADDVVAAVGECGIGRVMWLGIDPFAPALRQASEYSAVWCGLVQAMGDLLSRPTPPLPWIWSYSAAPAVTTLPHLRPPPVGALIGFGLVYAAIFGPLQVWALRRLRRTVRAWLVMPALAIALTVALVAVGQGWGSAHSLVNLLQIVETTSGSRSATVRTYCGVFSPTRQPLRLIAIDPAASFGSTWVTSSAQLPEVSTAGLWPDFQDDGIARFDRVGLVQYSQRIFSMERLADIGGGVRLTIDRRGGRVVNHTPFRLRDGYLYFIDGARGGLLRRRLPELAPGARFVVPADGWDVVPRMTTVAPMPPAATGERTAFRTHVDRLLDSGELLGLRDPGDRCLVAEIEGAEPDLRVEGLPVTNRATILVVRAKGSR